VDLYGTKNDGTKKSDTFFEELWAKEHPEEAKKQQEEEEQKKKDAEEK
jgi:hypothetical protein